MTDITKEFFSVLHAWSDSRSCINLFLSYLNHLMLRAML